MTSRALPRTEPVGGDLQPTALRSTGDDEVFLIRGPEEGTLCKAESPFVFFLIVCDKIEKAKGRHSADRVGRRSLLWVNIFVKKLIGNLE